MEVRKGWKKKYGISIGTGVGQHYPRVVAEVGGLLPFGINKKRRLHSIMPSLLPLRLSARLAGIAAARGITACSDDLKIALGQDMRRSKGHTGVPTTEMHEMKMLGERVIHEVQEEWERLYQLFLKSPEERQEEVPRLCWGILFKMKSLPLLYLCNGRRIIQFVANKYTSEQLVVCEFS